MNLLTYRLTDRSSARDARSLRELRTALACLSLVAGRWSLVDENENEIDNKPTDETNPSLRQF